MLSSYIVYVLLLWLLIHSAWAYAHATDHVLTPAHQVQRLSLHNLCHEYFFGYFAGENLSFNFANCSDISAAITVFVYYDIISQHRYRQHRVR